MPMLRHLDHMGLVISTRSAEAAACYVEGVRLLLVRSPDAIAALRGAVAADPSLGVALAALAMSRAADESLRRADLDGLLLSGHGSSSATRRERQHVEIIVVALQGDTDRASALGSDHLTEFPDDVLIADLVARRCLVDGDPPKARP
jgi:hypothetical protein